MIASMLTNVKTLLQQARASEYAVGVFNTVNLETTRAILEAAQELHAPVVLQITEKTFDYAGGRAIFHLVKDIAQCYMPRIPVGIHLDHGKSFEIVERAVEMGFPSVMYDGSRREYADNLAVTKKVVALCHARGVVVQAELGNIPYIGEVDMQSVDWDKYMTDPDQAKEFVQETDIDTLAVAIGNAHGFFTEREEPDYRRLEMIAERVTVPLVLHGASDWDAERVRRVTRRGIAAFNVDTATRVAFVNQLKTTLQESEEFDLRKLLGPAREAFKQVVKEKIRVFASEGKA
ncbi:MAG: class II fructose-bisphosphate aldolase [Nitrososphaera sp.]|nr:class II fructose-bisphosphate aldolase [Nitrososphaera sp.]